MEYKFTERLSTDNRLLSQGGKRCPEVWLLENGDYAIIGKDITDHVRDALPSEVELGDDERIVVLPQDVLRSAKPRIP